MVGQVGGETMVLAHWEFMGFWDKWWWWCLAGVTMALTWAWYCLFVCIDIGLRM